MSYSFTVRAATRELARSQVGIKLLEVLEAQPAHQIDAEQALAAAAAFIDLLPEDSEKDVQVMMSGSVSWHGTWGEDPRVLGAQVSVSAHLVARDAVPA